MAEAGTESGTEAARSLARRVEAFVRETIVPYEHDHRLSEHGPSEDLVKEMRDKARAAGVLTPHILTAGKHLTQRETAIVFRASGLSPLGPLACNTASPDEGNIYLLNRVASAEQKQRFLDPLISGKVRSAFLMTEPADIGGAGSDPSMLQTHARYEGGEWIITGRKTFITGIEGASMGIIMARTDAGDGRMSATMFLTELPHPAVRIERVPRMIDSFMPGGHAVVALEGVRLSDAHVLGAPHEGFRYAQVRLAPARLSHCMRWLGACSRAQEIATDYVCRRMAFGKPLVDHEGVGFMLAQNLIDLQQSELIIDWCADVLDRGEQAVAESSMAKVAVSEALMRVADRCVQMMGGTGVSSDTVVERIFREIRAFRIYDGPTEVHLWSLAKKIKREWKAVAQ